MTTIPYICSEQLNFLFGVNYNNGSLDGIVEYDGNKCWYECVDEREEQGNEGRPILIRTFGIYAMTHEQAEEEISMQMLYEDKVLTKNREDKKKYTEALDNFERPQYARQECLGWFIE